MPRGDVQDKAPKQIVRGSDAEPRNEYEEARQMKEHYRGRMTTTRRGRGATGRWSRGATGRW